MKSIQRRSASTWKLSLVLFDAYVQANMFLFWKKKQPAAATASYFYWNPSIRVEYFNFHHHLSTLRQTLHAPFQPIPFYGLKGNDVNADVFPNFYMFPGHGIE